MIQVTVENDFASWRRAARALLNAGIPPETVLWTDGEQNGLFENDLAESIEKPRVPADFVELSEAVACVDDKQKWSLLYRILFRLTNESRNLLEIESDEDVRRALLFAKAISRDVHKFHAFVRFRRIEHETGEIFIAWHEPQHFTVERAAPFFARRFGAMRFSILTPKGCAHCNLEKLVFTDGVDSSLAPKTDEIEDFWRTYYASTFNPSRLRVRAMKSEMPVRFWKNLPEAALISELVRAAGERNR